MIQINGLSSLEDTSIPTEVRRYLKSYIQSIQAAYQIENLEKIGKLYYLESHQDTQNYMDMGLRQPLKKVPFEECKLINLTDDKGHESITVFHALYLCNNEFSIEVIGDYSILDHETKQAFQENAL